MQRIIDPTAALAMPAPPVLSGNRGFFQPGVPGISPATLLRYWWLNMTQEEIMAVLADGGITPDTTGLVFTQLRDAIRAMIAASELSFTPVQQGGGAGQGTNKVYLGYDAGSGRLRLQVDVSDLGDLAFLADVIAEGTARASADTAEATARVGGDAAEASARASVDTSLQSQITAIENAFVIVPGHYISFGGFIIQWDQSAVARQTTQTFTFPITFPNGFLGIAVTLGETINATALDVILGANGINAGGYQVTCETPNGGAAVGFSMIAIGF